MSLHRGQLAILGGAALLILLAIALFVIRSQATASRAQSEKVTANAEPNSSVQGPVSQTSGGDHGQIGSAAAGLSESAAQSAGNASHSVDGPMSISVSPLCVDRAQQVIVTIRTVPLADVAHGVSFADGSAHNLYGLGQADMSGSYRWVFVIPLDAPYGNAKVLAAARHPEKDGGAGMQVFRVADEC